MIYKSSTLLFLSTLAVLSQAAKQPEKKSPPATSLESRKLHKRHQQLLRQRHSDSAVSTRQHMFPKSPKTVYSNNNQPTTYSTPGSICANSADNLDNFRCLSSFDCANYQYLHNDGPLSFSEYSDVWGSFNIFNWDCVENVCKQIPSQLHEMEYCTSGYLEVREISECASPLTCSSNHCQRPMAASCGNCTDDIAACMPGTVCNSLSNSCESMLEEGSRCVYNIQTLRQYFDGQNDVYLPAWSNVYLSCSSSQTNPGAADDGLFCNTDSGLCEVISYAVSIGESCNSDWVCEGYCDDRDGVCKAYATLDDDCSHTLCSQEYQCRYFTEDDTYHCAEHYSAQLGDYCTSDECDAGLFCNSQGTCEALKNPGDPCQSNLECAGLDFCTAGVCKVAGTGVDGDSCKPSTFEVCAPGYHCDPQLYQCVNVIDQPCQNYLYCSNSLWSGTTCRCNPDLSLPGDVSGNASCVAYSEDSDDSRSVQLMNSCWKSVGFSDQDMSIVKAYRSDLYDQYLCCMLCGADDSLFTNPYLGSTEFLGAVFGRAERPLICSTEGAQPVNALCDMGVDYSLAAAQSYAQCPFAPAYQGVDQAPRYVDYFQGGYEVDCGTQNCNGNGVCNSDIGECFCFDYAWGSNCQYTEDDGSRDYERNFLQALYQSTHGDLWLRNDGWNVMNWDTQLVHEYYDYCLWYGVVCNEDRFIMELNLHDNNLQGQLPDLIENLDSMEYLSLSGNMLVGEIPAGLFNMTELRVIDLSFNAFSGELPQDMLPSNLEALILNNNRLTGNVPLNLGLLESLTIVNLAANNFNGDLPETINNLHNVTSWDLTSNDFPRGSFLPEPLCPFCDRVYTPCNISYCGDDCVDGFLLACTSPRAYQVSRSKDELAMFDAKAVRSMRRILDAVPEQCVYRFD